MTMAMAHFEVERPVNWRGEAVDMSTYDGDLDYFEVEVEGYVNVWVDANYGADADGNRGVYQSGAEVEDLDFTLYGDFRPFYIKVRDFFLLKWKNRNLGKPGHRSYPVLWTQFSDYDHIKPDPKGFTDAEIEGVEEDLIRDAEDRCEPDPDEAYERYREDRW